MTAVAPTVYFIDDSATMREVIKIAFRRENINVLACHDGASALAQMEQVRPDVVISDVIMPDKDGYEVCEHIKQHAKFARTPVILMSGVVNRSVAERAFAVRADELIRKPFQPQDLIGRVRKLLNPHAAAPVPPAAAISANAALSSIFATPVSGMSASARTSARVAPLASHAAPLMTAPSPMTSPVASLPPFEEIPVSSANSSTPVAARPVTPPATLASRLAAPAASASPRPSGMDLQKLNIEILRLGGLVRKLQSELEAEREYSRALEAHIKTLQESE